MAIAWTSEQIMALAPDASSAKAGKSLASAKNWVTLGANEEAVWGECKGSAAKPYQAEIELSEPAFRCTCPSRKFPCKHTLGLFLMYESQPKNFEQHEAPAWVSEWLKTRTQQREKKATKSERENQAPDPAAQAKRANERQAKVEAGIKELELWLHDLVRQGLSQDDIRSYNFWDKPAARLIDAQAPGLARTLRELGSLATAQQPGWQDKVGARLGRLHLLMEGYKRIDSLPTAMAAEIRQQIGWTVNQDELLSETGVKDHWLLVGQRTEQEDKLKVQRNWLVGETTGQVALVLVFWHPSQRPEINLPNGSSFDGELVFFPGTYPMRAVIKNRQARSGNLPAWSGYPTIEAAYQGYTSTLVANPWLEEFPMALQAVYPIQHDNGWAVRDQAGYLLPVSPRFGDIWDLVALSGGYPISLFGEWDGEYLRPLSVLHENRFIDLVNDSKVTA